MIEFVEKYVTFYPAAGGWGALVWDVPPTDTADTVYRIRIAVPSDLAPPLVPCEVVT